MIHWTIEHISGKPETKEAAVPAGHFLLQEQLKEMLPLCDVLVIAAPYTAKTAGMIGPAELAVAKPGARLIVISRGGASSWYRDITTNYEDALSFYTPDEFRARNDARIIEQRGRLKHVEISSFDREIIAKVTEKRGLSGVRLLHPSTMYKLFDHFWFQRVPVTLIEAFTSFGPLPPIDIGDLRSRLPERYVVAKFYGNTALPDTPENQAFVASYLEELTRHVDVVLLNTGQRFDEYDKEWTGKNL